MRFGCKAIAQPLSKYAEPGEAAYVFESALRTRTGVHEQPPGKFARILHYRMSSGIGIALINSECCVLARVNKCVTTFNVARRTVQSDLRWRAEIDSIARSDGR